MMYNLAQRINFLHIIIWNYICINKMYLKSSKHKNNLFNIVNIELFQKIL